MHRRALVVPVAVRAADDGRMFFPTDADCAAAASATLARLDVVARELDLLSERLFDLAATARGLAASTDWHARAATVFHDRADGWAGEVSGLGCLAETARIHAEQARYRVALRPVWSCG